jgi:hypothetical protein
MKIELRPAFAWTCEECGEENFASAIRAEMSPDDLAELRDDHGIEPHEDGEFLTAPCEVTCFYCDTTFEAIDDREQRDE